MICLINVSYIRKVKDKWVELLSRIEIILWKQQWSLLSLWLQFYQWIRWPLKLIWPTVIQMWSFPNPKKRAISKYQITLGQKLHHKWFLSLSSSSMKLIISIPTPLHKIVNTLKISYRAHIQAYFRFWFSRKTVPLGRASMPLSLVKHMLLGQRWIQKSHYGHT